jgi:hypothetical protein
MGNVTTDPTVKPNTQDSVNSTNSNMSNVLNYQNQTHAAQSQWEARISINSKCWQILDNAIQALER